MNTHEAAEMGDWALLNRLREDLAACTDLSAALARGLDAAIELNGAQFGNIQLLHAASGELRIAAQRGFKPDFLQFFASVRVGDACACGRVLRDRRMVYVEDVASDPSLAQLHDHARRAGFAAVLSQPLVSTGGRMMGVVSVHFARDRPLRGQYPMVNRLCAFQIADAAVRLAPAGEWGEGA